MPETKAAPIPEVRPWVNGYRMTPQRARRQRMIVAQGLVQAQLKKERQTAGKAGQKRGRAPAVAGPPAHQPPTT